MPFVGPNWWEQTGSNSACCRLKPCRLIVKMLNVKLWLALPEKMQGPVTAPRPTLLWLVQAVQRMAHLNADYAVHSNENTSSARFWTASGCMRPSQWISNPPKKGVKQPPGTGRKKTPLATLLGVKNSLNGPVQQQK